MSDQGMTDEFRQNLTRIGVGRRYHLKTLADFPGVGEELRAWLATPEGKSEVFSGLGRSLVGGATAHDLFMVLARACYFRGITTKVISLSVLVHEVEGNDIATDLESAQALFVTPFYQKDYRGVPLTEFQRLAVEDFLNERMDNARAVFTLSSDPIAETRLWWSEMLIQRLQGVNLEAFA